MSVFSPVVLTVTEAMLRFGERMMSAMHSTYIADGAIYGDTDEGFLQWIEDISTIVQAQARADDVKHWHQVLRSLQGRSQG